MGQRLGRTIETSNESETEVSHSTMLTLSRPVNPETGDLRQTEVLEATPKCQVGRKRSAPPLTASFRDFWWRLSDSQNISDDHSPLRVWALCHSEC
jgi:hypothetical protein